MRMATANASQIDFVDNASSCGELCDGIFQVFRAQIFTQDGLGRGGGTAASRRLRDNERILVSEQLFRKASYRVGASNDGLCRSGHRISSRSFQLPPSRSPNSPCCVLSACVCYLLLACIFFPSRSLAGSIICGAWEWHSCGCIVSMVVFESSHTSACAIN